VQAQEPGCNERGFPEISCFLVVIKPAIARCIANPFAGKEQSPSSIPTVGVLTTCCQHTDCTSDRSLRWILIILQVETFKAGRQTVSGKSCGWKNKNSIQGGLKYQPAHSEFRRDEKLAPMPNGNNVGVFRRHSQ
jgi:hypothetical protein